MKTVQTTKTSPYTATEVAERTKMGVHVAQGVAKTENWRHSGNVSEIPSDLQSIVNTFSKKGRKRLRKMTEKAIQRQSIHSFNKMLKTLGKESKVPMGTYTISEKEENRNNARKAWLVAREAAEKARIAYKSSK